MLARHVSKQCHIPAKRLLKRVRSCKQQARLKGPAARYANVRGAFRARKSLTGQTVLLSMTCIPPELRRRPVPWH